MARSNGEGTVYQRKSDGKWVASFYEEVGGKRHRRVIYANSSKDAHVRLRKALNRMDRGLPGIDATDTFQVVAEAWRRSSMRTSGLAPASQEVYVRALKGHVYPVIGGLRLRDIKPSRVSEVLVVMEDKGLSKSYQHVAHKAMSAVFRAALADGLIGSNPCLAVKAPRGDAAPKIVPTREQVAALIDNAPDARMRAFVAVLAYTGVRIGEALAIEWKDVGDDSIAIRRGKGGKSRAVPITPALAEILRQWRTEQAAERLASIWWDTEHDYVLSSDCGTKWDPHNARKKFRPLVEGVESDDPDKARPPICPGATPHSLRHATATLLLEEGVPMKVVAELLGHSSTRITDEVYSHVTARLVAEAGNAIERALG